MPGSFTSSTYLPFPRMKRASSLRLTLWPIPPISTAMPLGLPFRGLAHDARRVVDRLHDVHVTGAAAEIPRDRLADLQLRRLLVLLEQGDGGHHHSGSAEAALQPVLLVEAFLDRMELPVLLEPLDGRDRPLIGLHGEHRARLHRAAVEEHRAGAAVGGIAADVRAGHPEVLAEEMDKERARLDVDVVRRSVDRDVDLERPLPSARSGRGFDRHLTSLPWRGRRPCGSRAA